MNYTLINSCSVETSITNEQFWEAVMVWHIRPNVINRSLVGVHIMYTLKLEEHIVISQLLDFIRDQDFRKTVEDVENKQWMINRLKSVHINCVSQTSDIEVIKHDCQYVQVKKLLFKNKDKINLELCFVDTVAQLILFHGISDLNSSLYAIHLDGRWLKLLIPEFMLSNKFSEWLKHKVLPKIIKWAQDSNKQTDKIILPLNLLPLNEYNTLYSDFKEKYGKSFVKMWPETTDPLKFVYEDVAIAAYLCLLWQNNKQKYVDFGCGNGLLVHILNSEGHDGVGLDVRSRKIWSYYPASTILTVETVTPSHSLCPDTDWIIGNHSDELTTWIPIIAARTSYNCKFFLLPCCPFELSGQRFQRRDSSKSLYQDHIEYIRNLCQEIGFNIKVDKLRIPSTKRICIVGDSRNYSFNVQTEAIKKMDEFITRECQSKTATNEDKVHFVPRSNKEKVRNCTQLKRHITDEIVRIVSDKLIKKQLDKSSNCTENIWNVDYSIGLKTLANCLTKEQLFELKKECGGLQTLLKNNHNIFLVKSGYVLFRKPIFVLGKNNDRYKKKPCWFHHNHPYLCPLPDNKCAFVHYFLLFFDQMQ